MEDHETNHDTQGHPRAKTSRHESPTPARLSVFIEFLPSRCGRDRLSLRLTRSRCCIRQSGWESRDACLGCLGAQFLSDCSTTSIWQPQAAPSDGMSVDSPFLIEECAG